MKRFKNVCKNKAKSNKGVLAKTLGIVLGLIIGVAVFTSAIHPTANSIKTVGQTAGQGIVAEQTAVAEDFQPIPLIP